MNDGVKILLERMQTHPEEFHGSYNRWTEVIERFEKFFNASERALINGALTNIRRDEFTQVVMNEILREPTAVEVEKDTYTINNVGSYTNAVTSIQELVRKEQEARIQQASIKEYMKKVAPKENFK
jgi:hypothetical protein